MTNIVASYVKRTVGVTSFNREKIWPLKVEGVGLIETFKVKKISNDQELIQSDPTSCPINQKYLTKYLNRRQFTKGTRGKLNEQLFPK